MAKSIKVIFKDNSFIVLNESVYSLSKLLKCFIDDDSGDEQELDTEQLIPINDDTGSYYFDESIVKRFLNYLIELNNNPDKFKIELFFDDIQNEYSEFLLLVTHLNVPKFISIFKNNDMMIFNRIMKLPENELRIYELKRKRIMGL